MELSPSAIQLDPLALLFQTLPQPQGAPTESEVPAFEMILDDLLALSDKPKPTTKQPEQQAHKDVLLADILPVAFPNVLQFLPKDVGRPIAPTQKESKPVDVINAGATNDCVIPSELEEVVPSKPVASPTVKLDPEQYDLKKIEFKLVPVDASPQRPSVPVFTMVVPQPAPEKGKQVSEKPLPDAAPITKQAASADPHSQHVTIAKAEPEQHIRAFVATPLPPPVARQISMDDGEGESQGGANTGATNDCVIASGLKEANPPRPVAAPTEGLDPEKYDFRKIDFKPLPIDVSPERSPAPVLRVVVPQPAPEKDKPAPENPLPDAAPIVRQDGSANTHSQHFAIAKAEPVQHIRAFVKPPPPPPVARQISMDVGDADSQVRIVIRESNGGLEVHFDAANDRLRQELQTASPLLVHQIERESRLHVVDLDFTSFGSATESDRRDQPHARSKKNGKSEAVFADVDETTYLDASGAAPMSL